MGVAPLMWTKAIDPAVQTILLPLTQWIPLSGMIGH